jgi:hypothetical protein
MSCGEQEYEKALASIHRQGFTDWDLFEIKNKSNAVAHQELYQKFMASAPNYEIFLKLDADMVLRASTALATLKAMFDAPDVDQVMTNVYDWPSGLLIPGMQAFSNKVIWPENRDLLMVDTTPIFPGKSLVFTHDPAPLADHMPDPSKLQSLRYGIHRALKAIQPDRTVKEHWRGSFQWDLLKNVWRRYREAGDVRRVYTLLGADIVLGEGDFDRKRLLIDYAGDYTSQIYAALVKKYGNSPGKGLSRAWKLEALNDARWSANLDAPPWM